MVDAIFVAVLAGAILYLFKSLWVFVSFKVNLAEVALIYLITNKRLIALNRNYETVDEMRRQDMEFLVDDKPHDPIIVTRRDDDDSENSFYMDLASHLPEARTIIQTLLQES